MKDFEMTYHFRSEVIVGPSFGSNVANEQLKNEPMFFNSSLEFAYDNGGPATRAFIEKLPPSWQEATVIDSRVHMLMPGWYPAIPGFHHDDVPRPMIPVGQHFGTAGQPDYDTPRYQSRHIMGLINAEIAPTQFALGECDMPKVPNDDIIYRIWHLEVERLLKEGKLTSFSVPDRALIHFDCHAFHQSTKATKAGWRWFARVSKDTERVRTITNEIRRQVQVYLEHPMEGW